MSDYADIPQNISRDKQMRMAAKWLAAPPVPRHKSARPATPATQPAIDAYMASQYANTWGSRGAYSPDPFSWRDYVAGPHMAVSNALNLPKSAMRDRIEARYSSR